MFFICHGVLIVIFIAAIIYTCSLFSNAIENLGIKLKLGNNATGSILAVIGTSLPETIVPLVAIFGALLFRTDLTTGQNIAKGAIIGSPFILSTLALFLMGVILFIKRKSPKTLDVDYKSVTRDCRYFICAYSLVLLSAFINSRAIKSVIVFILLSFYCIFVFRTIIKSKQSFKEQEAEGLIFSRIICFKKCEKHYSGECQKCSNIYITYLQIIVSLVLLIIFSHLFVSEIKFISQIFNINPVILSLMLAPVATELPEIVNSIIWLKQDKDDLAIANVIGAIVFQAMIPCSIGIALTSWKFDAVTLLNMIMVLICGNIFTLICMAQKRISSGNLLFCGIFYFGFLIFLIIRG